MRQTAIGIVILVLVGTAVQAARADMTALQEGATGTLRVGTYQSVSARILPGVMSRFRAAWPDLR